MARGRPRAKVSPCRFCNKQFKRLEHLQRHERIHTQDEPFSCHCDCSFGRQDLLTRHGRLYHSPRGAGALNLANDAAGQRSLHTESPGPTSSSTNVDTNTEADSVPWRPPNSRLWRSSP
ncbi:uncharacterized protein BDV17DRAFT_238705 [Aspergillus undulatus]|uniref:uncharacterized protein n=1 Tax=Aspergillus undulatus TaxID=1810928 RepID=UPI003CCCDF2A